MTAPELEALLGFLGQARHIVIGTDHASQAALAAVDVMESHRTFATAALEGFPLPCLRGARADGTTWEH